MKLPVNKKYMSAKTRFLRKKQPIPYICRLIRSFSRVQRTSFRALLNNFVNNSLRVISPIPLYVTFFFKFKSLFSLGYPCNYLVIFTLIKPTVNHIKGVFSQPTAAFVKLYDSGLSSRWYMINLLGEPLCKYHKIETLKRFSIYISAYQAIIRRFQ